MCLDPPSAARKVSFLSSENVLEIPDGRHESDKKKKKDTLEVKRRQVGHMR